MDRTSSERILGSIPYAVTLAGVILVVVFVMLGEWMPREVIILGAASALLVVLCWRGSRYVLAHAINAFILSGLTMLLATVPLAVNALLRHGYLLPRQVGVKKIWMDPVPGTLAGACIFIGLPLIFITFEALAEALQGEFLAHWPPLRWLQDRLIDR